MTARPAKGTPEYDLWIAAIEVAIDPPVAPKTGTTRVSSKKLNELRGALEAAGIDWRTAKSVNDS